jgi:hypothetical protein
MPALRWWRLVVVLGIASVAVGTVAPARAQEVAWPALARVAETTLDDLVTARYPPAIARFNEKMRAVATEDFLRQTMASLTAQLGAFKARTGTRTEEVNGMRVVIIGCEFERARVDAQIAFDVQERVAGLAFRPQAVPATAYAAPAYVTPAAFKEEDVTVDAGGWPLPGTLSLPAGPGPFPAVVLVHGSGQHDRDETLGPNRPFRDIAWGLASRGVAVLRYEKRTRQHQQRVARIDAGFTVKDEVIDDAVAAVALLRGRPGIRTDRIHVLGHSLGAMLAPRIAAAEPRVAGLVLMAGPVRSLEQSIVDQVRYLASVDGTVSPDEQGQIDMANALFATVRDLKPGDPPIQTMFVSAPASYWLDLKGYSAPEASRALEQPMLILQGERDYQVTMDDFAVWRKTLGDGRSTGPAVPRGATARVIEYKSYPGLNHLFMAGTGPSTGGEYMQPAHVDAAVVGDIATWIEQRN